MLAWVSREFAGSPNARLLLDPDRLFDLPHCEIVKDQRKIKVGRVTLELRGEVQEIYVKRYNPFSWRYRVGSLFAKSAALHSLLGAKILTDAGFFTGKPVAAVERRRWGLLGNSFYVSQGIPEARTLDAYWLDRLVPITGADGFRRRREFLRRLAELYRSLHRAGIYHNDLKDANVVIGADSDPGGERFCLLDLEGLRRYSRLSERRKIKNLVQLDRTMGRMLSRSQRVHALRAYLGNGSSDPRERRRWVQRILRVRGREESRSLRRRMREAAAAGA